MIMFDHHKTEPLENIKLTPAEARKSAGLSQNLLARQAELSVNAIQNIEQKKRLLYTSAEKILTVINVHRKSLELPELHMKDIDWKLR
jgi:DNA-binding transcriptional regulator YiaG